jgi:superfamily II DNA or RNA helicase
MELRYYQITAVEKLRNSLREHHKKIVMVLPTGGGKSAIFAQVIVNLLLNGKKVLWIVHRRNLVIQMQGVLKDHFGIDAGIIMSGIEGDEEKNVQLCTIQTYSRRIRLDSLSGAHFFMNADVVLVDECHRSISKSYMDLLQCYYSDKIIIGCTATPARADGRGLGELYTALIEVAKVKELTEQGFLTPARYFVPVTVDLEGVKIAMGDYVIKELDEKLNKAKVIGDVVENWLKLAEGRKTIVFAVNVAHSKNLCEAFNRAGVSAEHLDARSSDEERQAVFLNMEKGRTQVICNVALYQEGMDVPGISCVVIARPTKSMGLYRQCCGRGLRPLPGKKNCLILDHGNVIEEHGLLDWDVEWVLDGKERAWKKPRRENVTKLVKCRACNLVFSSRATCPDCGTEVVSFGRKMKTIEAELEELTDKKPKATMADKRRFFGMLRYYARFNKNYSDGWCAHKFKEKFKVWPNAVSDAECIQPDQEFKNWITYQNIKWAKSQAKAKAQENLDRGGELIERYQATNAG